MYFRINKTSKKLLVYSFVCTIDNIQFVQQTLSQIRQQGKEATNSDYLHMNTFFTTEYTFFIAELINQRFDSLFFYFLSSNCGKY